MNTQETVSPQVVATPNVDVNKVWLNGQCIGTICGYPNRQQNFQVVAAWMTAAQTHRAFVIGFSTFEEAVQFIAEHAPLQKAL